MSLLGFITGAASLFGGGDSSSSKSTTSQYSQGNSEQAASASETKTGTTTQAANSSGTSATSGTTSQTGTTTGKEASTTTGTTTNYSSDVLASLDSLLKQQLSGGAAGTSQAQTATDALSGRLQQVQALAAKPGFDVSGYVSGIAAAAKATSDNELDSRINTILSATGSSEGGNSMSALLGAKLRNESAANLAGITANAQATGEQIATQEQASLTSQVSGLSGDLMTNLSNLLAAAKGGTQQTSGAATTASSQQQATAGTTAQNTSEQATTNTTQKEDSSTAQTGLTQTTESGQVTTKTSGTQKSGDLFTKILGQIGSSAAAA